MGIERSIQSWMATATRICSPSFETCFQKRKSHEQHLRTALDFLIGTTSFYVVTTGASWNSQTSTLLTSPTKPISHARRGWPFLITGRPTLQARSRIGVMRDKNHELCAQGMLAQYLFHRYQIQEEAWLDFRAAVSIR
jgi:hypothetical protein